jgi:hypothetical protein
MTILRNPLWSTPEPSLCGFVVLWETNLGYVILPSALRRPTPAPVYPGR